MFGQAFLARGRGRGIDRLMVCGECPRQNTSHFWGLAREKKRFPIHVFLFRFFRGSGIESSLGNTKKKKADKTWKALGSMWHRKPLSFVAFLFSTIIRFSSPVSFSLLDPTAHPASLRARQVQNTFPIHLFPHNIITIICFRLNGMAQ